VRDITSFHLLVLKFLLFILLGVMAGALLIDRTPRLSSVLLLGCCIWALARAYYFCFYVLERYVDPEFRFAGLSSAVTFIYERWRSSRRGTGGGHRSVPDELLPGG
jgi:hypothetical protein